MTLKLIRFKECQGSIPGILLSKRVVLSRTLENPRHCLPLGTYVISNTYCKQRKASVLCICSAGETPNCDQCPKISNLGMENSLPHFCPQFSTGNSACKRSDGCIIVGAGCECPGVVVRSGTVYAKVIERMRQSYKRGFTFDLEIVKCDNLKL